MPVMLCLGGSKGNIHWNVSLKDTTKIYPGKVVIIIIIIMYIIGA